MTIHSPLFLFAALGLLSAAASADSTVDTSAWKCKTCPYPKGSSGSVDVGAGLVSDDSKRFGHFTGLDTRGGYLVLGGQVQVRGSDGYHVDASAAELGIDTRSLSVQGGREGLYRLHLGYDELPRYFADGARTPFLGNGGAVLSLPAGYPAGSTAAMPLGATLQPVTLGGKASGVGLGGSWIGQPNWTYRVSLRRDKRDGTQPIAGSFFATSAQLAAPVDHTTDHLELSASYVGKRLQASLGYQLSQFRQGHEALTWNNPFASVVAGDGRGQLALAPDNQFHQVTGSLGYQFSPMIRASADVAAGRMTQNAAYLASTLNTGLLPSVPALPSASLDGRVDTFNANLRLTLTPMPGLRVNAVYSRDLRDNRTAVRAYPMVSTDMFLRTGQRSNTPFDLTQDRIKLHADYRGPGSWRLSGGVDWDQRERPYTEVVTTRETTVWGRAGVQPREDLTLGLKLAHAERSHSTYGIAYWFDGPQNPLMRKLNLAARQRDSAGARADWTVNTVVSLGLGADYAKDDYPATTIGLTEAETANLSVDLALALSERTRAHAFVQGERVRTRLAGSQTFAAADWTGQVKDRFDVLGLGLKHAAIPDKLDIGADVSVTRARSDNAVQTGVGEPPFPAATTALDTVKLHASYKLSDKLSLSGLWWSQRSKARDWRLDGVQPATVDNLLAFGVAPPNYNVNVLRLVLRYGF